jgi:aldehyde:ferredoxin oxidoreductase
MAAFELKEIKTLPYGRPPIEKGYANQTLYVNLSDATISCKPVNGKMKETFASLAVLWEERPFTRDRGRAS